MPRTVYCLHALRYMGLLVQVTAMYLFVCLLGLVIKKEMFVCTAAYKHIALGVTYRDTFTPHIVS